MNERIKELSEQAQLYARQGMGKCVIELKRFDADVVSERYAKDFEEKFAELIVRECIKSILSLHDTAIDNEWNLDETFHMIVDTIAEDFDMKHIFRR